MVGSARTALDRRARVRRVAGSLAAITLLASPAADAAELGPTIYDLAIVRPLALVHTVAGAIVFLPAALQAAPGGTIGEAYNTFILAPMNDLANRPLGEF